MSQEVTKMTTAVVVMSGGQDSMTCLHWARKFFTKVLAVSFDYGQRHKVELECAQRACEALGVPWECITLPLAQLAPDSALINPDAEINTSGGINGLPSTFVPGRNLVMLTAAASYAYARGIFYLVTGVCQTDFSGYPDCREATIKALTEAIREGFDDRFDILTPLMHLNKAQTWALADELGALDQIVKDSHTCYKGERGELHPWGYGCGTCPACELRSAGWYAFKEEEGQ